jgi:hypothetical protein
VRSEHAAQTSTSWDRDQALILGKRERILGKREREMLDSRTRGKESLAWRYSGSSGVDVGSIVLSSGQRRLAERERALQ